MLQIYRLQLRIVNNQPVLEKIASKSFFQKFFYKNLHFFIKRLQNIIFSGIKELIHCFKEALTKKCKNEELSQIYADASDFAFKKTVSDCD